ncbi:MAG: WYL domain-containing protein, partial [Pseudomonadota bacterium]|nr:WYL domain-containing protein [Pseudomonadota bacterium]
MSLQEKETSNSLHRQWQILSRLSTGKWMGTRELQEMLEREGVDISLRTIQRDLNQIAQRFPIESNKTVPQGWRWRSDAPIQSLPHMTSSQAVTFMMVEEHLKHLLPPSLIEEMNPWFDLARRSLSTQNNVRQWINRVRIVPASQPLIPPLVDKHAQQAVYEGLLQDKQIECIYRPR